ncbi:MULTISPECIES: hypothetical protein [unclassified Fusibacter]|uniref:hypothetical protein n=1 Tax=unclassified Fusibacter TaxID=2624464 RepID=UPI0010104151|nr:MULTISPECIES: hypothetical protein [unclassified Fusibacter]MCK8061629.1 hypothetical protein [Fusibacter sp. A2]NPE23813.1 hypothetical protein [Fusibacter sp. A1]RXV58651.1 hypothetical protein DWB64_18680 [Fusibacter sp. A1]
MLVTEPTCEMKCIYEGIEIAKREGKFKGRKKIDKPAKWNEVYSKYMSRELTATKAIEVLGLKRNTFYKFVAEEKESA